MIGMWVKEPNTMETYIPLRDQTHGENPQLNSRTQNQLISIILKSRGRILDFSFTDLKVDVGHEDELV